MGRYSYVEDVGAGCVECNGDEVIWHDKNAHGVAARHHQSKGHTTWVKKEIMIVYGDYPLFASCLYKDVECFKKELEEKQRKGEVTVVKSHE